MNHSCLKLTLLTVIIIVVLGLVTGCDSGSAEHTPSNIAPHAEDIIETTAADTPVIITLTADDVDGDILTFIIDSDPENGTLDTSGLPDVEYTPNGGFTGVDTFTFHASDGTLDSNTATVYIGVANSAPTASNMNESVEEDSELSFTLSGEDANEDTLTCSIDSQPSHGILDILGILDVKYTPDADYYGDDSFTFHVTDGVDESAVATVSITVTPVNDPPVADDQYVLTLMNLPKSVTLTGSDLENDPLSFFIDTDPMHGALDTSSLPDIMYTPDTDYTGEDSFTFYAHDGTDPGEIGTVTINVGASDTFMIMGTSIEMIWILSCALGPDKRFHVLGEIGWHPDMQMKYICKSVSFEHSELYNFDPGLTSIAVDGTDGRIHFITKVADWFTAADNPNGRITYWSKPDPVSSPDIEYVLYSGQANQLHPGGVSIALTSQGNPLMVYHNEATGGIWSSRETPARFAFRNNIGTWFEEHVEVDVYDSSESLAISEDDIYHYVYYRGSNSFYRYSSGGSWQPEVELFEGLNRPIIKLDSDGNKHVLAMEVTGLNEFCYLTDSSGSWVREEIGLNEDDVESVYDDIAFDVDSFGSVFVVYREKSTNYLKYVTNYSGIWEKKVIDDTRMYSYTLALAADRNGYLYIGAVSSGLDFIYITNDN